MKTIGIMKFVIVPELFLRLAAIPRRLFAAAVVFRNGLFRVAIIFIRLKTEKKLFAGRRRKHKRNFDTFALFCDYLISLKPPKSRPKAA